MFYFFGGIMPVMNNSTWSRLLLLGIFLIILVTPFGSARADVGPKPSMDFTFEYVDLPPLTILGGALIECEDSACTDGSPLEELGPQRFTCEQDACHALAYSYAPYHRLMIDFSDGVTRQSNVFEKRAYNANYAVTVRPDGMQVKEGWGTPAWLVGGMMLGLVIGPVLLCLVGVGGVALVIFFIVRGSQSKVHFSQSKALFILAWLASLVILVIGTLFYLPLLIFVTIEEVVALLGATLLKAPKLSVFTVTLLANLLTIPATLIAVIYLSKDVSFWYFILFWVISWILESIFLGLCLRHELGFGKAFGLVLVMNLASITAGFLLPAGLGFGL
jgi:hypothetical protein